MTRQSLYLIFALRAQHCLCLKSLETTFGIGRDFLFLRLTVQLNRVNGQLYFQRTDTEILKEKKPLSSNKRSILHRPLSVTLSSGWGAPQQGDQLLPQGKSCSGPSEHRAAGRREKEAIHSPHLLLFSMKRKARMRENAKSNLFPVSWHYAYSSRVKVKSDFSVSEWVFSKSDSMRFSLFFSTRLCCEND